MLLIATAPPDVSSVFIELGAATLGLALLSRFASRFGISAIPLYLLAGLAKTFFERAIALGGGESSRDGLQKVVAELRRRKFNESVEAINQKYAGVFRRLSE